MNCPVDVAVPPAAVILTGPVVVPVAGTAVRVLGACTVKLLADVPLNVTAVTLTNSVPVIVIEVPTRPFVGVKPEMVGAANTMKLVALVAVPAGVVTVMGPVVAPAGTLVARLVVVADVTVAVTPLNVT